jgi:hypothetical protein
MVADAAAVVVANDNAATRIVVVACFARVVDE